MEAEVMDYFEVIVAGVISLRSAAAWLERNCMYGTPPVQPD